MCMVSKQKAPVLPPELAAMRSPDGGAIYDTATRRVTDQLRSGSNTILTSSSGVLTSAPTEKKTLLGA